MHANRPFLLGHSKKEQCEDNALRNSVTECISAAKAVLETVDNMASDGSLFHAFWWTGYVTFCALAVVYVWQIQQRDSTSVNTATSRNTLSDLAEKCHAHLTQMTSVNSPSRRYSIILEELRLEAKLGASESAATLQQRSEVRDMYTVSRMSSAFPGDSFEQSQTTHGGALFSGPQDDVAVYGVPNVLNGWETIDWLDLDSSVRLITSLNRLKLVLNLNRHLNYSPKQIVQSHRMRTLEYTNIFRDVLYMLQYVLGMNLAEYGLIPVFVK